MKFITSTLASTASGQTCSRARWTASAARTWPAPQEAERIRMRGRAPIRPSGPRDQPARAAVAGCFVRRRPPGRTVVRSSSHGSFHRCGGTERRPARRLHARRAVGGVQLERLALPPARRKPAGPRTPRPPRRPAAAGQQGRRRQQARGRGARGEGRVPALAAPGEDAGGLPVEPSYVAGRRRRSGGSPSSGGRRSRPGRSGARRSAARAASSPPASRTAPSAPACRRGSRRTAGGPPTPAPPPTGGITSRPPNRAGSGRRPAAGSP